MTINPIFSTKPRKTLFVYFSLLALTFNPQLVSQCYANSGPFKTNPELHKVIKEGLHALYNFDFDKSLTLFNSRMDEAEEHPMIAFGIASAHWWRISSFVLEGDEKESQPFLDAVDVCIKAAENKIEGGDPTGEGNLVMGGAYGLLGRWQATNRKWLAGYLTGKKAYRYLQRALEQNPEMTDAYMGLGIFDYFVTTLPAVVRILAFTGMGGDPQVGIDELHKAAYDGVYAKVPSKLFLSQIYMEGENKPAEALIILDELKDELPNSPFINMMMNMAYYNSNSIDLLKESADRMEQQIENGIYSIDYLGQMYFSKAAWHFKKKQWDQAALLFEKASQSGFEKDPWKTWALVYLGYCYDAMGQREMAVKQYDAVILKLRRWGSHDNARKYLKTPWEPTDENMKKLTL